MELIKDALAKIMNPNVTSEQILAQVNQTAQALKKPKKLWTESESSDLEGMFVLLQFVITYHLPHCLAYACSTAVLIVLRLAYFPNKSTFYPCFANLPFI